MIHNSYPDYLNSVHHDGSSRYLQTTGEPNIGSDVTLYLRAALNAPIRRVLLRTEPDGEQRFDEALPAEKEPASRGACRWWRVSFRLRMPSTGYRFLLFTDDGAWWYNQAGVQRSTPTDANDFRILADYSALRWLRDTVFYQIFPDRFYDGDPASNVADNEFTYRGQASIARRWGEPPTHGSMAAMVEFFGGDLPGVEQKLDYLADLGVNGLYLTPIFSAFSNHRYDVVDYFNVDAHLGGNAALASLRQKSAERGMKILLDIVPNHCGVMHPWFQQAQASDSAPTADYFTFHRRPDEYESWLGVRSLPKLNYTSPSLRQAMYAGPASVFRHWLRPPYAADGWRLDVANMLGRQGAEQLGSDVLAGIRQAVKEENPQAYLLGENFFDAVPQLQGDGLDAVMNYAGFCLPLRHWLHRFEVSSHGMSAPLADELPMTAGTLAETWNAFRSAIPWQMAVQQYNLLGSHDVARILSLVKGNTARTRLAAGILMTYVGVPGVYYGDEIGLGDGDPAAMRACMDWRPSTWNNELTDEYRRLIVLRRASPALQEGGFQVLLAEGDTLAYLRDTETCQVIVVAQRGPAKRPASPLPVWHGAITDGVEFSELHSGRRARVENGCLPLGELSEGVEIWLSV